MANVVIKGKEYGYQGFRKIKKLKGYKDDYVGT
jgi:hypothetical protein